MDKRYFPQKLLNSQTLKEVYYQLELVPAIMKGR